MAVIGQSSSRISLDRLTWQTCCVLLVFHLAPSTAKVLELKGSLNSSVFNDQSNQEAETEMDCIDWEGKAVADGEKYIPFGSDLCMQCLCKNRFPILCQSVACSAPQNCPNAKPIAGTCCEYECEPGDSKNDGNSTGIGKDPTKNAEESITNLSLRLIASTVTSLLFLALLLFMVYRLRQRRLLLAMRRFEARSRNSNNEDTDSEHYIPDNLLSLECPPYTDPPPPYSPPKPPHIYQGEQPPPYDEISMTGNFDGREANGILQPGHSASVCEVAPVTANRSQGQPGQVIHDRELPRSAVNSQGHTSARYPVETLPAYASTDVVQGLDSILTTRAPASQRHWNNNRYSDRCVMPRGPRNPLYERNGSVNTSSGGHPGSLERTANERHNMPTVTAFQRFSSLFKRNAPKSKNRNSQTRPMSECHPPPQYATLPHESANSSPNGYMRFNNSGWQARTSGRSVTRSLTDRMCFSYDSARAAYELAAMSPSTSSNSSSSLGPPSNSPRRREGDQQNPLQTQQFQDDLRRHLPPLQTSDSSEFMTQTSPGTCPSTLSPSSSSVNQTPVCQRVSGEGREQPACLRTIPHLDHVRDDDIDASHDGEAATPIVYDLTGSLQHLTSSPSTPASRRVPMSDRLEERQRCVQSACSPSDVPRTSTSHQSSSTHLPDPPLRAEQEHSSLSSNADNSRNVCNNKTPSPPMLAGVMRRSQSGISVCSETGEKKLRDAKGNVDLKVLASDSQYPEHHSLSRCKPGMLSRKPESPLSKQVEETNLNVLDNSSYSSHPKDVSRNNSQVPATLFVPPVHSVGDEGGKTEGRVVSSQESPAHGELYGACVQENDLNKGPDTHNPSALITSLNICPPSPFVTVQSGQLIPVSFGKRSQHGSLGSAEPEARLAANMKNLPQEGRKTKKKKNGKDKHPVQPSPRHRPSQKPKHATNPSPGNDGPTSSKSNVPCQDMQPRMSSKFRPARSGEKKKQKGVGGLAFPVDVSDSPAVDWMSHSYDDAGLSGYGNADVYRSYCCDVIPAKSVQPAEYPSVQGYPSDKIALGTSGENRAYSHGYHVADRSSGQPKSYLAERPNQPPLTKKKPTHKHQASVGERIPYGSSPSRQHPKSLAGSGDRGHGRRGEPPESTSFEHSRHSAGKGAKSGFGQDLNFDDQQGMIDFFNHGVDYSAARSTGRGSFSNDCTNASVPANVRSHARGGVGESVNHHHHQHGNSRSGLSNDLSFVNGSHPAVEKGKKRASLPSLPMFSCHSQGVNSLSGRNQSGKMDERVEREDRHRNSVPDESLSQATSYV